jgi:putative oxidoreductase
MKFLYSTKYSDNGLHFGLLILRVVFGLMMIFHGIEKLEGFSEDANGKFWSESVNFLGLGGKVSLGLVIFAEYFCAGLLIFGLFTRFSLIVLIICMGYAWGVTHGFEVFEVDKETKKIEGVEDALIYLIAYIGLYFTGPGKFSVDQTLAK